VYRPVPRADIVDALVHLRDLHRQIKPSNERELHVFERRELLTRNLLSNLRRTGDHPTLSMLLEVADMFSLTVEGAHRLFGYNLSAVREYDLRLNGGRTHIVESCRRRTTFEGGPMNHPNSYEISSAAGKQVAFIRVYREEQDRQVLVGSPMAQSCPSRYQIGTRVHQNWGECIYPK
jgi:hypothetical protein